MTSTLYIAFSNLPEIDRIINVLSEVMHMSSQNVTDESTSFDIYNSIINSYIQKHSLHDVWNDFSKTQFPVWITLQVSNNLRISKVYDATQSSDNTTLFDVNDTDFSTVFEAKEHKTNKHGKNITSTEFFPIHESKNKNRVDYCNTKNDFKLKNDLNHEFNHIIHSSHQKITGPMTSNHQFHLPQNYGVTNRRKPRIDEIHMGQIPNVIGMSCQHDMMSLVTCNSETKTTNSSLCGTSKHGNRYRFEIAEYRFRYEQIDFEYVANLFNTKFECVYDSNCKLKSKARTQFANETRSKSTALYYCQCEQVMHNRKLFDNMLLMQFSVASDDTIEVDNGNSYTYRIKVNRPDMIGTALSHFRRRQSCKTESSTGTLQTDIVIPYACGDDNINANAMKYNNMDFSETNSYNDRVVHENALKNMSSRSKEKTTAAFMPYRNCFASVRCQTQTGTKQINKKDGIRTTGLAAIINDSNDFNKNSVAALPTKTSTNNNLNSRGRKRRTHEVHSDSGSECDAICIVEGKSDPNSRLKNGLNILQKQRQRKAIRKKYSAQCHAYESTNMRSQIELEQIYYGFYSMKHSDFVFDEAKSNIISTRSKQKIPYNNNDPNCCPYCLKSFHLGEVVAIHDGCDFPHPFHKPCFEQWACRSYETPNGKTETDALNFFRSCYCQRTGQWREWTFSKEKQNWNTGRYLPHDMEIIGIHEYKKNDHHYLNYIVNSELFYSIKVCTKKKFRL